MPVATSVAPVIMPALCSHLCQSSLSSPLYTTRTQINMPVMVTTEYKSAIKAIMYQPFVPAKRKYASISMQGEKNMAMTNAVMMDAFVFFSQQEHG